MPDRSPADILLFLTTHSTPEYYEYPVRREGKSTPRERMESLLLACSGTTRYKCPTKELEEFLGSPISFEKHLRPLMEMGALFFEDIDEPGGFYDSPAYRKAFDHSNGRVKDYSTGVSWVAFHYKENNFLPHYDRLCQAAKTLGISEALQPKKRKPKSTKKS